MIVKELGREQITELKQHYYCERNENVSWGELADIDNLVTDTEIFEEYSGTYFVEEDFCNQEIGDLYENRINNAESREELKEIVRIMFKDEELEQVDFSYYVVEKVLERLVNDFGFTYDEEESTFELIVDERY